jgi:hypothetical protein
MNLKGNSKGNSRWDFKGISLRICAPQTPNKTQLKTNPRTRHSPTIISICVHQFISHLSSVWLRFDLATTCFTHCKKKFKKNLYFWLHENPGCYTLSRSSCAHMHLAPRFSHAPRPHSLPWHVPPPGQAKVGASGGGGAHASPLAVGSHPDDQPQPSPPFVAKMCFKCFRWSQVCCNYYIWMLRAFVQNVSSVLDVCCDKCVYPDVAYVSHTCCKCFIWMLHMF